MQKVKFQKLYKKSNIFFFKFKNFLVNLFKLNYGFVGVYESFESALSNSKGYSDEIIFEKLKKSALKFLKGNYSFERDTVLFKKNEYNHPILQSLILTKKNDKEINICDYGGSLGSLYFQNNSAIKMKIKWSVIDLKNVVLFGKTNMTTDSLNFFHSVKKMYKVRSPNTLLMSGFIQYVNNPFIKVLSIIRDGRFDYIILDRVYFLSDSNLKTFISIQYASPKIYDSSYPCYLFNYKSFVNEFYKLNFEKISEWDSFDQTMGISNYSKGFVFKKIINK